MTYKVTLNDKIYEVEVEQGEAIMVSVSDAFAASAVMISPAIPVVPAASVVQAVAPAAPAFSDGGKLISSPLPGSVIEVKVTVGQSVKHGQVLLLIEAMKMENEVLAPRDGVVKQIIASKGASVETGAPLLTLS